jgi:hypothetical protein
LHETPIIAYLDEDPDNDIVAPKLEGKEDKATITLARDLQLRARALLILLSTFRV